MSTCCFRGMVATGIGTIALLVTGLGAQAQVPEAQGTRPEQIPALVRAAPGVDASVKLCWTRGYLQDKDPAGTNLRAGPNAKAALLKRTPNVRIEANQKITPELEIIGSKDGWFLVRNIRWEGYELPGALIFKGPAWISTTLVGATMEDLELRLRPEPKSPLVMKLMGRRADGTEWSAGDIKIQRMHGCSGSMIDVTFELPGKKTVRGWANGACANQVTTCGGGHMLVYEESRALVTREGE